MISLVTQLICPPARAGGAQGSPSYSEKAPAFTHGCLSTGLGCAVAVAEGGLCWLGGKGEEPGRTQ